MWQEGVMGGGGDDWYNVILLTATAGVTVNITDGDEDIDIVGTGSQQAVTIHDENSTYLITANENGLPTSTSSVTTDSTSGKLFTRELKMAAIEVTFDDDFRSQSFTISDGTTTSTAQTFPATGNTMDIFVPSTGTWTISSSVSGDPYTSRGAVVTDLDGTYVDEIHVIPVGATVTPVNDIQLWLECAAIRNKPYTKLEEVLADEITLIKLMSDSNAVDYLKRSTKWINAGLVPAMTDATHPSGEVSAKNYVSSQDPYYAFDKNDSTYWQANTKNGDEWIQYNFTQPVKIEKYSIKPLVMSNVVRIKNFRLEGSNDNFTTPGDILDIDQFPSVSDLTFFDVDNSGLYSSYRLIIIDNYDSASNTYSGIVELQLYPITGEGIPDNELAMQAIGAYDYAADTLLTDSSWGPAIVESEYVDEVINISVPSLSSNTPEIIVSSQSSTERNKAYNAFDDDWTKSIAFNSGKFWYATSYQNEYLGYDFGFDVLPAICRLRNDEYTSGGTPYYSIYDAKIQYSDDNLTWNDAGNQFRIQNFDINDVSVDQTVGKHRYWRLFIIQSSASGQYCGAANLQFLSRADGGVQSWLKAAGISKPYTTLDEVIADSDALATLVTDHNAVDYLVTAKALIEGITSSAKAMRYIGYRNYCAGALLADADWAEAIANSEYFESVLNAKVPTLSSDDGNVIRSSVYRNQAAYEAWKAYDGTLSGDSCWHAGENKVSGEWIGYRFTSPIEVRKVVMTNRANNVSTPTSFKIQGSNDNFVSDINDIQSFVNSNSTASAITEYIINDANADYYSDYRLYVNSASSSTSLNIGELQFYGREDVDETKIRVISAVQDTVKDVTSGTATTLCTTDSNGIYDIARTDIPNGDYVLESTVAFDPDGDLSTEYFQKKFTVTDDTVEIAVMPEDTFYWYGYGDSNLEDVTTANGWATAGSGFGLVAPAHNTNNIDTSTGNNANFSAVATKDLQSDLNLVNYIVDKGFTVYSSSNAYICYICSNKSYSNQDYATVNDATGFNGHIKLRSTLSIPRIVWGGTKRASNTKIYGMYNTKHNAKANFFGAANDTVYYTVGGTDIVVAETNEIGEAVVDFNSIPSGVILKSSVAKDPDNLSNDYTKLFIPPLTEKFYMMPDNALYWYGWISEDLEEVTSDNGWTPYSGCSFTRPEYKDNYIIIKSNGSSYQSGISSKKASKGMPRAFVQGVTISSSFYGYLYNRSGKSLNAGGLDNVQIDSASLKLYSTNDVDTDKYGVIQVSSSQEAKVYGFWYDVHSNLANFFSAANDRVYYLDGSTPVYVAETNGMGEAWLDLSKIPNGVTLYSSVAKDPSNLSNPFSKAFTVGADGKFYLMPSGDVLYWYGYIGKNCEDCTTDNGWSDTSGSGTNTPTPPVHNVNSVSIETTAQRQMIGVGSKVTYPSGSEAHSIVKGTKVYSSNRYGGLVYGQTKNMQQGIISSDYNSNQIVHYTLQDPSTNDVYYYSAVEYINNYGHELYALWVV